MMDLVATLALADTETAGRLVRENPDVMQSGGALHLMAKRNDLAAVRWLLANGADPNGRWAHWDAEVTPLHLAASQGSCGGRGAAPRGGRGSGHPRQQA